MIGLNDIRLNPREEVLWSEWIDDAKWDEWLKKEMKSDRLWGPVFLVIGVYLGYLVFEALMKDEPEINFSLLSILLFSLFFFWLFKQSISGWKEGDLYRKRRPLKFYVLTNQRFLGFDEKRKLSLDVKANKIQKVAVIKEWKFPNKWVPKFMFLYPVAENAIAELHFLTNFDESENKLNEILKGRIRL